MVVNNAQEFHSDFEFVHNCSLSTSHPFSILSPIPLRLWIIHKMFLLSSYSCLATNRQQLAQHQAQRPIRCRQMIISLALQKKVSELLSTQKEFCFMYFPFLHSNAFSIHCVDTPQNSPHRLNQGNSSTGKSSLGPNTLSNFQHQNTTPHPPNNGTVQSVRVRKLSNSSMASDVSFRLPAFETSPTAYSFQSDLDASASEFEDSASTVGYEAQLDVISKEKLYDAYKKSLERYQKYRSRYTELVRRYRDLERDNNKARVRL